MGKKTKKRVPKRVPKRIENSNIGTWRDPIFWRDLFFYFIFFSYIGHYIEMGWTWFCHLVLGTDLSYSILANPFEPYTIYGAGAVICILVVRPLVKKLNHHIVATFLVATLACAALELLSSIALTIRYGFNPYWSYFDRFMNFNGHICLGNCILFGLLATVFLRLVYPLTEKILRNSNQLVINIFLVVLVIMFGAYYLFPA